MSCSGCSRDQLSSVVPKRGMKLIIRRDSACQKVWFGTFYSLSWNLREVSPEDDFALGIFVLFLRFKGRCSGRASSISLKAGPICRWA